MATEVPEAGYESIRKFIDSGRTTESSWDYIELRDSSDAQVIRVSVTGDSRASWTHAAGDQTLTVEIEVAGSDSDIPTGTTFTGSALFNESSGGSQYSYDGFPDATIETTDDTLIVTHNIEVPQV